MGIFEMFGQQSYFSNKYLSLRVWSTSEYQVIPHICRTSKVENFDESMKAELNNKQDYDRKCLNLGFHVCASDIPL